MPNAMHLHILGSGSKGNCSIVESPAGFIMIDNGFSRRETLARMHALGLDESRVRALILTHEHSDHTRGVVVWCKRFSGTLIASAGTPEARSGFDALPFQAVEPGEEFDIKDVHVQTFPTSHDVVNPMGLRLSCGDDAIGFATDTGTLSDAARMHSAMRASLPLNATTMSICSHLAITPAFSRSASSRTRVIFRTPRQRKPCASSLPAAPKSLSPCTYLKRTTDLASRCARSPARSVPHSTTTLGPQRRSNGQARHRSCAFALPAKIAP